MSRPLLSLCPGSSFFLMFLFVLSSGRVWGGGTSLPLLHNSCSSPISPLQKPSSAYTVFLNYLDVMLHDDKWPSSPSPLAGRGRPCAAMLSSGFVKSPLLSWRHGWDLWSHQVCCIPSYIPHALHLLVTEHLRVKVIPCHIGGVRCGQGFSAEKYIRD